MVRQLTDIEKEVLFEAKIRLLYGYIEEKDDTYESPLTAMFLGKDPVYRELMGFEVMEITQEASDGVSQPTNDNS